MPPRRPNSSPVFPASRDEVVPWVAADEQALFEAAFEAGGFGRVHAFHIQPSVEKGSIVWMASEIGLIECLFIRRPDADGPDGSTRPQSCKVTIYSWEVIQDPEYRIDVMDDGWQAHLHVGQPTIEIDDVGGTGGPDFLGFLAREILKRARGGP
jgi:hypothetical protein